MRSAQDHRTPGALINADRTLPNSRADVKNKTRTSVRTSDRESLLPHQRRRIDVPPVRPTARVAALAIVAATKARLCKVRSQEAVETYGWLRPGEMLDGLGMAETTPGPLIIVTQFVGFMGAYREAEGMSPLLAGVLGGVLTTWVTFTPCFLWIFLGAPFVEALRGAKALNAALAAITAAVVGVILNLALWFGLHVLFSDIREVAAGPISLEVPMLASVDGVSLGLTLAAAVAAFRFKMGVIPLLGSAAAAGVALHLAGVV